MLHEVLQMTNVTRLLPSYINGLVELCWEAGAH